VVNFVVVVRVYQPLDQTRTNVSDASHFSGTQKSFFPGVEHVNTLSEAVHYDQAGVKFAPMRWRKFFSSFILNVTNAAFHHSNLRQQPTPLRMKLERRDRDAIIVPWLAFETAFVIAIDVAHGVAEKFEHFSEITAHTLEVRDIVLIVFISGEVGNCLVARVAFAC
jgi:hypothetical protein